MGAVEASRKRGGMIRQEEKTMRRKGIWTVLALCAVLVALPLAMIGDASAAATLSTQLQVGLVANLENTTGLTKATAPLTKVWTINYGTGTGAGQADKIYTLSAQAITTGATLTIDVAGSLTDAFGAAFTPAKLRTVYIYSYPANTTNLTLFGDAASVPILNTAATTTTLVPGSLFLNTNAATAGIAVTATTGDIIKIVNAAGATATIDLVLIGTSS